MCSCAAPRSPSGCESWAGARPAPGNAGPRPRTRRRADPGRRRRGCSSAAATSPRRLPARPGDVRLPRARRTGRWRPDRRRRAPWSALKVSMPYGTLSIRLIREVVRIMSRNMPSTCAKSLMVYAFTKVYCNKDNGDSCRKRARHQREGCLRLLSVPTGKSDRDSIGLGWNSSVRVRRRLPVK